MKYLYVDNIRGFSSTFLSLKEVNFFVGENSTGKTSILKLIGILSSTGFWKSNEFNNKEIDLGLFSEIVNNNSKKEFFEIGVSSNNEKKDFINAVKFRFIGSKNDLPQLKELSLLLEILIFKLPLKAIF